MSIRGSKNKIIFYIVGVCSALFVVLLYHNASQRLEEMEKSYERCHLNEESLSAQLQVNLEYKVRLEKSLQQEKIEHTQIKDDLQNKVEEERQARERENLESVNKFSALQQQYKFLQSEHEDLNLECSKLRQSQLNEVEEKGQIEKQLQSVKNELKLIKASRDKDLEVLKVKLSDLEKENILLRADKKKLINELRLLDLRKPVGSQIKLPENLPLNMSVQKTEGKENILLHLGVENGLRRAPTKSSTSASKADQELIRSENNIYVNTSTPMINPDALMSQDKILSAAPVPQPRHESLPNIPAYGSKENVVAKPEEFFKQKENEDTPLQGVLRAPDIMKDFAHVPAIQEYKERFKPVVERNNNGGEVGDEGEPIVRNNPDSEKRIWKEGGVEGLSFVRHPAENEIMKNQVYQYQAEYDRRKEEAEDDDDVDPPDYHNGNEKNQKQEDKPNIAGIHVKIPFEDKHDSVMIQPK